MAKCPNSRLLALAGLLAVLSGCSPGIDSPSPEISVSPPTEFSINQPRRYFVAKWGPEPVGPADTWRVDNMTASIKFLDGQAGIIRYTLPTTKWTEAQVIAALQSNGSGWRQVESVPGGSAALEMGQALFRAIGGPNIIRFVSAEGTEATLFTTTMTIKSAAELAHEQSDREAALKKQQSVPRF